MISDRDLLALSIIGERNRGVDTSRAEAALDRLDEELLPPKRFGVAVFMAGWSERGESELVEKPSWTGLSRREAEGVVRLNRMEGRIPTALVERDGSAWRIIEEFSDEIAR